MREVQVVELGLSDYRETWSLQRRLVAARKAGATGDVLMFCEHPHVITLGRSGRREHLLASEHVLQQLGVEFIPTDRGGDITYHGPGQIVGYPILNLGEYRRDVSWYVRQLEEVMLQTSADFGISALRIQGRTGIWVEAEGEQSKLGAIGVHLSRWVTSHGFAYNVSSDLRYFDFIVACGIRSGGVASLEQLLRRSISIPEVVPRMVARFCEVFDCQACRVTPEELERALSSFEKSLEPAAAW